MERSDRPWPPADPAAKTEPPKPPAESDGASASDSAPAASPPPPEADPFVEAEAETAERVHFETLERETTQPVRRYFTPRNVHEAGGDLGATAEEDTARAGQPQQADAIPPETSYGEPYEETAPGGEVEPSDAPLDHTPLDETPLEPWPDQLETTRPPSPGAPEKSHADTAVEATSYARAEHEVEPAPSAQADAASSAHADAAPPSCEQPDLAAPAFEPHPFAVPAPRSVETPVAPSPVAPTRDHVEPHAEPLEPQYELEPRPASAPQREATPAPEPAAPTYTAPTYAPNVAAPAQAAAPQLRHDIADAWGTPIEALREQRFDRPDPALRRTDDGAAAFVHPGSESALPVRRDWRDLVRRVATVAFLVGTGWFLAVLLLIAAYRFVNPPFSMLMALQRMGGTGIHREWVPLERISPNLTRAVVVAEDGRFCQHWGVDFIEAAKAIKRASNGYPRGASTITMQVAKNLFLVPTKSYLRKMIEIPLTFAIELAWPKRRILEVYLNIVEWGPGIFGAEAASQAHFRRSAMGLSPRQAAQLAVTLPNPIVRDAGSPGPRTARRAATIQARAAGARSVTSCIDRGR